MLNKSGLEFGGPSKLFSSKGIFPVYPYVKSLDNCNFSSETIWDGEIKSGQTFVYENKSPNGYQYILDIDDLNQIPSGKYDFILGSHVIEHFANPIKALYEWKRILKNSGSLIVILPHKDGTFDNKRKVTNLTHIIEDYKKNTGEDDLTHLEEILELHDLKADEKAGSFQQFKERSFNNYKNRCLHHHVFNSYLAAQLFDFIKLKIISVEPVLSCHIILVAKKTEQYDNQELISNLVSGKFSSPFKSDKFL